MRLPLLVLLVAGASALGLGPAAVAADPGTPSPYAHRLAEAHATPARAPITVGGLTLRPCAVVAHAWCGHLQRPWEPGHPAQGTLRVGFAFAPARDRSRPALGTFVPHEGGPGYSTTGSGTSYAAMYGPLLRRHNLLLVDQRGTGRSAAARLPRPAEPEDRLLRRRRALRSQPGRPQRRLHQRALRRRPRRRDPPARPRPGRPVRRLLRHLLRPGLRRAPPRPAAQHRARRCLPDPRRDRVVPDPGTRDALGVRQGLPRAPRRAAATDRASAAR